MVLSIVLARLADWVLYQLLANSCYRAARKIRNCGFPIRAPPSRSQGPVYPNVSKCPLDCRETQTLACDINGTLLRSPSFFPYFMLVAFEAGGMFRALLLLLAYPFLWVLDQELGLRAMVFITFCGLRYKDMVIAARAVLPKFFLENLNLQAYEVLASAGKRVVCTSVPRIMVEGFLKEYLEVDHVVGTELQVFGGFFTGLLTGSRLVTKHEVLREVFGDEKPDIGLGSCNVQDHHFMSLCKEAYVVSKEEGKNIAASVFPREKYPKPLIFHDGRLAFLPTPFATLTMFLWLPLGIPLAIFRLLVGIFLPYRLDILVVSWSGVRIRAKGCNQPQERKPRGVLYVCSHRTLLDPVFLSSVLGKPVTAVTYSLSKMSELISPIKTVRLSRDRKVDGETMQRLLGEGDLVVCPEGTTCREPYLLRFSSLFAELADEIVPVAMNATGSMFYGTTASGFKCLDPIFFLMNPFPSYDVQFLGKVPKELTCSGGKTSWEVANHIQKQMADALGFECTSLTRRDKYMVLAGNEGIVADKKTRKKAFD